MESHWSNPEGRFEDRDFVDLVRQILATRRVARYGVRR